jgi:transcriptional regulator with XRE-family HTH domain
MEPSFEEEYLLLGLNIAYYRRLRGMTQAQLAEKICMSTSYLSKIECGNYHKSVSLTMILTIARGLDVQVEKLLMPR